MEVQSITIPVAFIAGLFSFLSPCVLPLVPGYVSLMSGISIDHLRGENGTTRGARRAVILNSLAFNAGLSIIFVSLGAAAGFVGSAITNNFWVRTIGGLVVIAFGLQLIGVLKIASLYKDTRFFSREKPRGLFGSLTLGLAFAAGWTPCIGPILGGIIGLAATSGGWKSGLVLSSFYSAGLAVPFLGTGLSINRFLSFYGRFRQHLHKVEVASGVILIGIGLLIVSNKVTVLNSAWLAKLLPNLESKIKVNPSTGISPATSTSKYASVPDLEFAKLNGGSLRLSELRGRVVVLNFWATWCLPCRAEIPVLSAMQRELEAKGLTIVGISYDDEAHQIHDFQKELRQDYAIVLGGAKAGSSLPTAGLPTTYIIDRQGNIRERIIGERSREAFEAIIKPLLDEPSTTAIK